MKIMKKVNKKVAVGITTGVIAVGSMTGGAYAYKEEFTPRIQKAVQYLVGVVFKDDIQNAVDQYGNVKEKELETFGNSLVGGLVKDLQKFKADEINRGKSAIDSELQANKNSITQVVNDEVEKQKNAQQVKTDGEVNESKEDMNNVIDSALDKVDDIVNKSE